MAETKRLSKIYVLSSNKLTRVWFLVSSRTKSMAKSFIGENVLRMLWHAHTQSQRETEAKKERDRQIKITI